MEILLPWCPYPPLPLTVNFPIGPSVPVNKMDSCPFPTLPDPFITVGLWEESGRLPHLQTAGPASPSLESLLRPPQVGSRSSLLGPRGSPRVRQEAATGKPMGALPEPGDSSGAGEGQLITARWPSAAERREESGGG